MNKYIWLIFYVFVLFLVFIILSESGVLVWLP